MPPLIPVGFYAELRGGKPHEPGLRAALQRSAGPDDAVLIGYLDTGAMLIASGGIDRDIIDPSRGPIGAPHILTDGTYAWPAILSHYVFYHHVRLPDAFLAHARANAWTIPADLDVKSLTLDRDAAR